MVGTRSLLACMLLLPTASHAANFELQSTPLIDSHEFDEQAAKANAVRRIRSGIYDGYEVNLCVDDPPQCAAAEFQPYRQVIDGEVKYLLNLDRNVWEGLPDRVKDAVVREILYYTWDIRAALTRRSASSSSARVSMHRRSTIYRASQEAFISGLPGQSI